MQKILVFVRIYKFSLLCIAAIWYFSIWFMPPRLPELENVAFIDKWTHFIMYGGTCSVIWWEYVSNHTPLSRKRLLLYAWLAPVVMSGCIELIQENFTDNRAGEWLDLAANATGCTLGAIVGLFMARFQKKHFC